MTPLDLRAPPAGFFDDPFPVYRALREKAPLCPQADGSFILSRHADLRAVYRDPVLFRSDKREIFAPKFGEGTELYAHHTTSLVFNDPPYHARVRKALTGALTPRAIARLEPQLAALVERLLDGLSGAAAPDLVAGFAAPIPIQVIGDLLGVPEADRGPLRGWSLAILGALEPVLSPEDEARGNAAVREFGAYLRGLIAARRAAPGDPETDMLTRLIAAGGLSEAELVENCIFILNAGHETTTNLIGNGLGLLARHPEVRARLLSDPGLMPAAVDEMLRLESPNQFGNRQTTAPVTFHGVEIPPGTDLHLCIGAANRDPEAFPDPDAFAFDRPANLHLAFANGAHTCIGLALARMEARVALTGFLRRYPGYRLEAGARHQHRMRFRGYEALPVELG
ncbi:cytochrome P450 [Rhodobacterales bacterium HKCCE2091]|nr:cytochrome P450 [Rhodobacterales bacterium HKCCE2091]